MPTFQSLIDLARDSLQDADKLRNPDAEMLRYANHAMRVLRRFRRDLYFGTALFTGAMSDFTIGQNWPLEDDYAPFLVDYLIARAESKNDEFADTGKVMAFFQSANVLGRGG